MSTPQVGKDAASQQETSDAITYLPLVKRIARRLARRLPSHVGDEDLVGAGVVGLLEALARYEPDRNVTFKAYAEFRIKGAILDELRRRDLMARDARSASKNIEKTIHQLHQELGRTPADEDVADAMGISMAQYHERLARLTPVQVTDFDDAILHGQRADPTFDEVNRRQLAEHLAGAIGRLNERQQQVLHLYYREDLNLKEIGAVLGVSESRISQILTSTTLQLRALLDEDENEEGNNA